MGAPALPFSATACKCAFPFLSTLKEKTPGTLVGSTSTTLLSLINSTRLSVASSGVYFTRIVPPLPTSTGSCASTSSVIPVTGTSFVVTFRISVATSFSVPPCPSLVDHTFSSVAAVPSLPGLVQRVSSQPFSMRFRSSWVWKFGSGKSLYVRISFRLVLSTRLSLATRSQLTDRSEPTGKHSMTYVTGFRLPNASIVLTT